jgi:sugar/nucleoside kinase (ribokinase family)
MIPTVAVVGTIFMDCKGFAKQKYNPAGRNLGSIKFVHGGVGRNVAENMANLLVNTMFVSSVDRTGVGREVTARLAENKVNTEYVLETEARGMGMWLAVIYGSKVASWTIQSDENTCRDLTAKLTDYGLFGELLKEIAAEAGTASR